MADTIKVLIIDDNEDDRALYRRVLQKNSAVPCDFVEADDGEQGLLRVEETSPDCVLLDYSLPRQSGIEVLKQLRAKHPFVPVVMLTGQGNESIAVTAMQAGAQNYISKSILTPSDIQHAVTVAIEHCALQKRISTSEASLSDSQRRSEELLALLDTLQSTAPVGFAFVDRSLKIVRINDALALANGSTAKEQIGRSVYELLPALGQQIESYCRSALETNESHMNVELSTEAASRSGVRHWLVSTYPVRIRDNTIGIGVVVIEMTEKRRIEEQLHQSQKMEAIGQLTGGVAHDFNNLLTVILANSDTLAEELTDREDLRSLAEMTRTAAERGAELTNGLLAFARRQALEPHVVDINKLVTGMDGLLRRSLGENIEIELVRGAGLWKATVDPVQLESAILNLSINARDAMPKGGRLTIETGNSRIDERYSETHDEVAVGQYVLICVSDTGTGMPAEVIARAFDPFFSTKDVGKGTGLGLSMVYGFVKQSGGHIKIYSEVGFGTSIKIYLPRSATAGEAKTEAELSDKLADPVGSETILVVEDHDLVRQQAERQLRSLGYHILIADNGPAALEILRTGVHIDLLFTDVVMPGGMGGRQLAEQAAILRPSLKILYTSGYTENAIVHHGRLDAGAHLLRKPYRRRELALKLRQLLGPAP